MLLYDFLIASIYYGASNNFLFEAVSIKISLVVGNDT